MCERRFLEMFDLKKSAGKVNWILLGLTMLIPGLLKLFVVKPSGVETMLSSFGFPAAGFLAWILILAEIVSGGLILAKWRLEYAVVAPVVILLFAAFTANWGNWPGLLVHLTLASNYLLLGLRGR